LDAALTLHRLHFAFTITFHYLFPQLTMGLAPLILLLKIRAYLSGDERYHKAAQFWIRIFAINFAFGVVTGIPMEFQFGTNWSRFSKSAGGVIGQTLAMEGVYSFFLESTFLGILLYGERRVGQLIHLFAAIGVFLGSWLSGFFIIATDAWMQHPVGFTRTANGAIQLTSLWELISNPWIFWMYLHNMSGAVVTGSFVMASLGAYYLLARRDEDQGRLFLKTGLIAALISTVTIAYPTGDGQGRNLARWQPAALAAAEGLFHTERGASIAILGQPDSERQQLDNPVLIPQVLGMLTYHRWNADVRGLNEFPRDQWPDQQELLYYGFHIMVGLGTVFIGLTAFATLWLWLGRLFEARTLLWILMLAAPFPYIANTCGWMTAELGRQPWLIYGLLRTQDGFSSKVTAGNTLFTLLGFMGIYVVLAILFVLLMQREIDHGPSAAESH
jgi:cytochrome d ubiquinol oxidase subunit I